MRSEDTDKVTQDQEKEIVNILVDSTLYLSMSMQERQRLLDYLVSSYFKPVHGDQCQVFRTPDHRPRSQ